MSEASPSRSTSVGLSALNFFTAAVQTGFGPFLPVYLTQSGWTQGEVGLALSLGAITSVASQVPAGFLVDHIHRKRLVAAASLGALGLSALVMAVWPSRDTVWGAEILYGFGAAVLNLSVAALTLELWGHAPFGERVGHECSLRFARQCRGGSLLRPHCLSTVPPPGGVLSSGQR